MRIISVKLHNVFRFGETNNLINFDEIFMNSDGDDMVLITGSTDGDENDSNGAGKSTIGEAIYWAFFEQLPRLMRNTDRKGAVTNEIIRRGDDNEIAPGIKEAYVELHFKTKDGRKWRLKRGRKISKSGNHSKILELDCDGVPRGGDIDQQIDDIIVSSPDSVMNSIFFAQMDTGKFLSGTDSVRRNILMDLRGMNVVDKMLKILRETDKKEANKIYDEMSVRIDVIKERVDGTNDGELRKQKLEAAKSIEGVDENIKSKEEEIEALEKSECIERATSIEGRKKTLESELESVKKEKVSALRDLKERVDGICSRKKSLENQINVEIANEKKALENEFARANKIISGHSPESLSDRDRKINDAKKGMESVKADQERLTKELKRTGEEKYKAECNHAIACSELNTLNDLRGKNQCPTCGNTWSEEEMAKRIDDVTARISEISADLEKKKATSDAVINEDGEVSRRKASLEAIIADEAVLAADVERIKAAKDTVTSCKRRAEAIKGRESRAKEEMDKILEEEKSCNEKYVKRESEYAEREKKVVELVNSCKKEMDEVSVAVAEVNAGIKTLRAEITALHNGKSDVAAKIAKIDEKLDARKRDVEEIADMKKKLRDQKRVIDRIEYFERQLANDIKNDIAESCAPLLTLYANEFLSILRDGMRVEISSDGKNVPIRLIGSTASTYNMLSGGEQSALRLAVSMALSMISIGGAADLPDMIFLDEIFGALDSKTRENVFRLLRRLNKNFERIVVITHDSLIKEVIKNNIHIDKKDGISSFAA